MAIVKCGEGHFFDNSKYDACPHCADAEGTALLGDQNIAVQVLSAEAHHNKQFEQAAGSDEKTVGLFVKKKGIDPVTGWLVCVEGEERGRDYRLHSGRNFVGRSYKMQVCIADDDSVSRENHCSVVYEPNKAVFLLVPGLGTNTYLNGERLDNSSALRAGDRLGIGSSTFEFIPYCGADRRWED